MNYEIWNIRGIATLGRKERIIDVFSKTKPTIIGFQETKRERISDSYLKSLVGNRMFSWMDLPAIGTAGGLLLGVDTDVFYVLTWEVRDFSISCTLKIKSSGVTFRVINV